MWTEYARQTRWGHHPEAMDEEQVPPGSIYVKQVIWLPCSECDLQVHSTVTHCLTTGVTCPECGRRLRSPSSPSTPVPAATLEQAGKVLEEEERFRKQVER
jgi:hypothetical protein